MDNQSEGQRVPPPIYSYTEYETKGDKKLLEELLSTTHEDSMVSAEEANLYNKGFFQRNTPNIGKRGTFYFESLSQLLCQYLLIPLAIFYTSFVKFQVYTFSAFALMAIAYSIRLKSLKKLHKYLFNFDQGCFIVDFATLKVDDKSYHATYDWFIKRSTCVTSFTPESLRFQFKILDKSAIGPQSVMPYGVRVVDPPEMSMKNAREEALFVFKNVVGDLFSMTKLKPTDVDILIVNCSLFCPTPSLSSMIINMFQMRENVLNYNLGGMGCSAGLISIDLAKDLLKVHPNSRCLVVSTENITQNWYLGNEKGMLMSNTLFRMGGAAILLSNRKDDYNRSKFRILDTLRVHRGADKTSYDSVYQEEDKDGIIGVRLSKELINVAGQAIRKNLTRLLTRNLRLIPFKDTLIYFGTEIARKFNRKLKPYQPPFTNIFQHFCIHAGGRGVLDKIGEDLKLGDKIIPSRAALYRFGNTSSASWFVVFFLYFFSIVVLIHFLVGMNWSM